MPISDCVAAISPLSVSFALLGLFLLPQHLAATVLPVPLAPGPTGGAGTSSLQPPLHALLSRSRSVPACSPFLSA